MKTQPEGDSELCDGLNSNKRFRNFEINDVRKQGSHPPSGSISREDVAQTLVRALQKRPKGTLTVAVQSKPLASPFRDWDQLFANIDEAS